MMLSTQNNVNYDKKFDVLYYLIGDTSNSYGDEEGNNIIFLKDINTDKITGITVLNFKKCCLSDDTITSRLNNFFNVKEVSAKIE